MRVETVTRLNGSRHGSGFDADAFRVTITTRRGAVLSLDVDAEGYWEVREGGVSQHDVPPIRSKGLLTDA